MKKLRVGIIGQGRSGYDIHASIMRLLPGKYKIAAVADLIEDRRIFAEKELGCDAYADYKDLFKRSDIDLIVNATPSHLHPPVTIEALEAGFNVLCEKPAARYVVDFDKMVAASKKSGTTLAIYQQSRFAPYFQQVRKVIDSGILGRIVMVKIAFNGYGRRWDWQTLQEFSGGNLLNTGPHPLDQALQLFGTDIMPEVKCIMDRTNTFGDAEDHVKLLLTGKDRPTIDLEISSASAYTTNMYEVYGTRGALAGDANQLEWRFYNPEEMPPRELIREPMPNRQYCSEKMVWHIKKWKLPESQADWFGVMGKTLYNNLYDAITKGTPTIVKLEEVRRQIEVIEESHRQNPMK
jgi:scyllo-inositol 2-dehydrogenase (NADP+)